MRNKRTPPMARKRELAARRKRAVAAAKKRAAASKAKVKAVADRAQASAAKRSAPAKAGGRPQGPPLRPIAAALAPLVGERGKSTIVARPTRKVSDIVVGKRHRTDLGNLDELADLFHQAADAAGHPNDGAFGLLQAIGITPDNRLIFGERRLKAWARSRFKDQPIPVHVIPIDRIVRGEQVENSGRKDFTPSEAVAIAREVAPLMQAAAKDRQRAHGGTAPGKKKGARSEPADAPSSAVRGAAAKSGGRAADAVASYVGKDRKTLAKAAAVVDAAEQDPDRFGKLRDDMDRTGNATGPFRRLQNMRQAEEIRNRPPPVPMNGPYGVMAIDFPWPHEPEMSQEQIDAQGRSLRPYPAMSIKAGCHFMAEQLRPILKPDAWVLFWVTGFHMPYAFHLLAALGLHKHSTIGTWTKDVLGRGQVLRDKTEYCIIAKRGKPPINLTNQTTDWSGPGWEARANSQKPAAFYALVEELFPAERYASIFSCGGEGEKWDCHGDQVGKHAPHLADASSSAAEVELADETVEARMRRLTDEAADRFAELDGYTPAPLDELRKQLIALEAVQRGDSIPRDEVRTLLEQNKWIEGKRKLKLTDHGQARLGGLRMKFAAVAGSAAASAPDDYEAGTFTPPLLPPSCPICSGHQLCEACATCRTCGNAPDGAAKCPACALRAEHVVSHTIDEQTGWSVGTCKCGARFTFPRIEWRNMDAAIADHLQAVFIAAGVEEDKLEIPAFLRRSDRGAPPPDAARPAARDAVDPSSSEVRDGSTSVEAAA